MINMTLGETANALNAANIEAVLKDPHTNNISFQGVSIDTRQNIKGTLFVAFPGTKTDGHDFIAAAKAAGAHAALVTRPIDCDLPQIIVKESTAALGLLGKIWRHRFHLPLVAVTGSNGKTTLKNMIASILLTACGDDETSVLATKGTLNNHLGLPLTLAELADSHRYGVIEMGMNHFGEIKYLTELTEPQIAIITNAAASHLAGVGNVEGVAKAKAEIFLGLKKDGIAILNRDDAFFTFWQSIIPDHRYLTFGFHPDADIRALDYQNNNHLHVHTPEGELQIKLPLLGKHNAKNALAAIAATLSLHIPLSAIKEGLEKNSAAPGRLEFIPLNNNINLINDTYNANPFSLQAALDALTPFHGKKMVILADMKELGEDEKSIHASAGIAIREAGVDYLFTYGELSAESAKAFGENGAHFDDQQKLLHALKPLLSDPVTILVKGSRSMQMEKIVRSITHEDLRNDASH